MTSSDGHIFRVTGPLCGEFTAWWRHQMKKFSALLAICAGNSSVPGEFPAQRPVTGSFNVFFDLRLNKQLSKQSWGWWFEMLPRPLWGHCNGSPGNSPHKGQWRGALMFSLICAWINSWVNNHEAGDLRCYRAHYEVTAMGHRGIPLTKPSDAEPWCFLWSAPE